jgi:serine/threonine protein kinase
VKENIRSVYKIGKVIGSGNFGTVRLASPYSNLNKVYAVKSIPRAKIE